MIEDVQAWRAGRDAGKVQQALDELRRVAEGDENIMPATIALAEAGGTTGEWAGALREVFGEYRAPTGVAAAAGKGGSNDELRSVAARVKEMAGGPPRFLVAKPGLDGHSNGAEQIAVAGRDAGMEVIYQGIRLSPQQIAAVARDEDVDVIGLSILSGSHLELVPAVLDELKEADVDAPLTVGGIIPEGDRAKLLELGVAETQARARLRKDVRGERHVLLSTGQHQIGIAAGNRLCSKVHCLETRAAYLVDGESRHGMRYAAPDRRLTCRILSASGGDDLTEDNLIDLFGRDARGFEDLPDQDCAESGGWKA